MNNLNFNSIELLYLSISNFAQYIGTAFSNVDYSVEFIYDINSHIISNEYCFIFSLIFKYLIILFNNFALAIGPITIPIGGIEVPIPEIPIPDIPIPGIGIDIIGTIAPLVSNIIVSGYLLKHLFGNRKNREPRRTINLVGYRVNPAPPETVFPVTVVIDLEDDLGRALHQILFEGHDREVGSAFAACQIQDRATYRESLGYVMDYSQDWRFSQEVSREYKADQTNLSYMYKNFTQWTPDGRTVIYDRFGMWMPISTDAFTTIFRNEEIDVKCDGSDPQFFYYEDPHLDDVIMLHIPVRTEATVRYLQPEPF